MYMYTCTHSSSLQKNPVMCIALLCVWNQPPLLSHSSAPAVFQTSQTPPPPCTTPAQLYTCIYMYMYMYIHVHVHIHIQVYEWKSKAKWKQGQMYTTPKATSDKKTAQLPGMIAQLAELNPQLNNTSQVLYQLTVAAKAAHMVVHVRNTCTSSIHNTLIMWYQRVFNCRQYYFGPISAVKHAHP